MRAWQISAAAVLLPGLAQAAPSPAVQFSAVLQNAGHHATVLAAAKATPGWAACPAAKFNEAPEVGVYLPVKFDADGLPIAGEWREGLEATGCGAPVVLNVLTAVTAPGTLATGPLLPGGTIADPELQNAAQKYAVAAAGGVPAGCKQPYVANTTFGGYEGKPDPALPKAAQVAPWKEAWTLSLCGVTKQVVLHFAPDAMGTKINTDPRETTSG